MIKRILLLLLVTGWAVFIHAQDKALTKGMKITKSTKIKKGIYKLDAPADPAKPVILIEGDHIVVDFKQATLRGSNNQESPDNFRGLAVLIQNSKHVTIRNLKARGYKIALQAINVDHLTLDSCDFSYNYRQHLASTQEKEDMSDWMSYHHNEKDEWLRYGAAIYLGNCDSAIVRGCRVSGGQNGLMMTLCNDGYIYNNDISFNSGIGIGMYRSSRNRVMFNRVIFNVRGYSHGVYNRGQDSAGMLLYEQSNDNYVYGNNVTHGGDGFFLWAGQTTMDTGKGGCNDNIIKRNDFSYAPTNGVEATFSRNTITGNRIFECDHGIWGGYSYHTLISDNQFRNNRVAIAIEHGQYNQVYNNLFIRDREAIRLWSRAQQPADWGYARARDTRSVGYVIHANSFNDHGVVFNFSRTDSLNVFDNTFSESNVELYKVDTTVRHLDTTFSQHWSDRFANAPDIAEPVNTGMDPFKGAGKLAGRKNIRMTEWGPYDFRSPIIWHSNPAEKTDTMRFDLLAPAGNWKILRSRGVSRITSVSGKFPASITAIRDTGSRTDILIELAYSGPAITTPFGEAHPANKPYHFRFRKFFQPLDWEVLFFSMDTAYHNPIKTGSLFSPLERKAPFKTERVDRLDYAWWGGIKDSNYHHKQFITMAHAGANLKKATYELAVTWDDAVRVYVDNELVIDEWNPSKYNFDQSPHRKIRLNLGGNHQFRVEHLELGGFATLSLKLRMVD